MASTICLHKTLGVEAALKPAAVRARVDADFKMWVVDDDGASMSRSFVARNFMAAMAFLNSAAEIAERLAHHPDLHLTSYRNVKCTVYTHAVNGVSEADFVLARELDAIAVDYSPKFKRELDAAMSAGGGGGGAGGAGTSMGAPPAPPLTSPDTRALARECRLTTAEVAHLHAEFSKIAAQSADPNLVQKGQFMQVLEEHHVDWRNDAFLERLFKLFDADATGAINFREYVLGMATVSMGSARDKFQLSFDVFDIDGSGQISHDEMVHMLTVMDPRCSAGADLGLQDADVAPERAEARAGEIASFVTGIFADFDRTGNGKLTLLEFLQATLANPSLVELAMPSAHDD